ncbi:sortase [Streptomyces sp. GC420]|uniref:sortase n=1 Tax=Streptomyces sp. GC420 TaxID=2697568 RepID=UPI001414D4D9|nr:sortase [Streptomyces sp. GC420]NBM15163.1 sortase [Streptomyces sp. GC420]
MRSAAAATGMALGVVGLSAAAATAAGDPEVRIGTRHAAPGSTVTVSTTACGSETYGKGQSEVAGMFHLFPGEGEGVLTGTFRVPEGTRPGSDTVILKCPPRVKVTGSYDIVLRNPSGAVEAGFGSASDRSTQLVVGSVLLGGAAAGVAVRVRRRIVATPG